MRDVDRLLCRCQAENISHIDDVPTALINDLDAGHSSPSYPRRLAAALARLVPGTVLAERAAQNAMERQRRWEATRPRQKTGREYKATKTVPETELPIEWRAALSDMRLGFGSAHDRAPAPKMVPTIAMKLRQLAKSAADRGLPIDLSIDALAALHVDMTARGVSSTTKRATCSALGRFAKYIGAREEVRAELRKKTAWHDAKAAEAIKRKEIVLQNIDVSAGRVLTKAQALLADARATSNPRSALSRRNEAFCLAVFAMVPLRLSDARWSFGVELTWDDEHWNLQLTTSKNGVDYACRLNPYLTPFIDAVLLQGLDAAYLEVTRRDCIEKKRPVLMTRAGTAVGYNYVSDAWRKYFGTGVHIVRTELHEVFAAAQGAEGTELALAACAQTSPKTASHYHTERLRKAQLHRMQNGLLQLAATMPADLFRP